MNIRKKITAVVLAAASALSLTSSVSAATASTNFSIDATALMAIPPVTVTWPTATGVILNPYKMKVDIPTAAIKPNGTVAGSTKATAVDYSVLSPEMKFLNTGASDVAITVSEFDVTAQTVKNADGTPLENPTDSANIKLVKVAVKHETVNDKTGAVSAGDTANNLLMYLEVATQSLDEKGKAVYSYTDAYDAKNTNQLVYDSASKTHNAKAKFFTIPAKAAANGETHVMVRGDMAYNPTIPWSQVAATDQVSVHLVFDVVLATPQDHIGA